ncbi:hypothetical protein FSPOR_8140 [Fusarium sporotrichioides]|uniref:Uncharacterized protein n=1 Tax=Fusarium sporotrichioides TaxID=5514 RepID=A0A395RVZ3_FUSSP|nr:hypothetical protein FSPOR_8140 [Fusarium sporotrichioides]
MKFSITSLITVLAVTSNVSAWYVQFLNEDSNCEVGGETEYQILTGNKFDCYNFGASLNGIECDHFRKGGSEKLWECKGTFKALAAKPKHDTGSVCKFYAFNDCSGVGISGEGDQCITKGDLIGDGSSVPQRIASFRCSPRLRRHIRYSRICRTSAKHLTPLCVGEQRNAKSKRCGVACDKTKPCRLAHNIVEIKNSPVEKCCREENVDRSYYDAYTPDRYVVNIGVLTPPFLVPVSYDSFSSSGIAGESKFAKKRRLKPAKKIQDLSTALKILKV